jgi:hypothetical protein
MTIFFGAFTIRPEPPKNFPSDQACIAGGTILKKFSASPIPQHHPDLA